MADVRFLPRSSHWKAASGCLIGRYPPGARRESSGAVTATRPATLAGVELPEGARLFLWLAAAGSDATVFPGPDQFDIHRSNAGQHLAFGKGLHYCLGANLGKLEAQIAVAQLARRYPRLRLAANQELTFHPNISFRGPQALKVRTGRADPAA
jgi:cytochrome P450